MDRLKEIQLGIKAQKHLLEKTQKRIAELEAEEKAYHIAHSTWIGKRENNEVIAIGNFSTVESACMNVLGAIYGKVTHTNGGSTLLGFGSGGVIVGSMRVQESED